jgi:Amt family ammonium transporter
MIFTVLYVGFVYPILGSWKWGGGFLQQLATPFYDFAGSTLVHSVGGWAALVAVILLGARIGKIKDGKVQAIPGHNSPLATAGVLILWLGWFGFNGGSVLSADPELTSLTLVTTSIAAAAGGVFAVIISTIVFKNLDLTMFLNGILGGLVGITAGADQMSPTDAVLIGAIAGLLIVAAVSFFDRLKLDDPVGAIAVHLVCGIWGTLAVGLFGALASADQFLSQLTGVAAYAIACIVLSFLILGTLKFTLGIRVSEKEELEGLDIHEHGMSAYSN